jgi:hypothetical protein
MALIAEAIAMVENALNPVLLKPPGEGKSTRWCHVCWLFYKKVTKKSHWSHSNPAAGRFKLILLGVLFLREHSIFNSFKISKTDTAVASSCICAMIRVSNIRLYIRICAVECPQPGCRAHRENRNEHICEACPAILSLLEWPLKVLGFAPSVPSTHQAESDLEEAVSATPDGTWTQTSRVLPAHQARFPQVTLQEQIKDIVIILPCAQPATLASSLQPWEQTAEIGLCNYGGLIDPLFTDVEGVA